MQINILHPNVTDWHLGFLPEWLRHAEASGTPTAEFLNKAYMHGGGWQPFKGFTLGEDNSLNYPEDPPQKPYVEFSFTDRPEKIYMYDHAWVSIVNPDRSFEVCRMD